MEIHNLPDFSPLLGCYDDKKEFIHLGQLVNRTTACGGCMGDILLSRSFTITCPECIAELEYRSKHKLAATRSFGVVAHKKEKE